MNETYKVWTVYAEGFKIEYYVINTTTRKIQSAWLNYADAIRTCNALNMMDRSYAV